MPELNGVSGRVIRIDDMVLNAPVTVTPRVHRTTERARVIEPGSLRLHSRLHRRHLRSELGQINGHTRSHTTDEPLTLQMNTHLASAPRTRNRASKCAVARLIPYSRTSIC